MSNTVEVQRQLDEIREKLNELWKFVPEHISGIVGRMAEKIVEKLEDKADIQKAIAKYEKQRKNAADAIRTLLEKTPDSITKEEKIALTGHLVGTDTSENLAPYLNEILSAIEDYKVNLTVPGSLLKFVRNILNISNIGPYAASYFSSFVLPAITDVSQENSPFFFLHREFVKKRWKESKNLQDRLEEIFVPQGLNKKGSLKGWREFWFGTMLMEQCVRQVLKGTEDKDAKIEEIRAICWTAQGELYKTGTEKSKGVVTVGVDRSHSSQNHHRELLRKFRQIILYGPPGTGKTYKAREIARQILGLGENDNLDSDPRFKLVVFHPAFEYEQFMRGLRPSANGSNLTFVTVEGHFVQMCWRALFMAFVEFCKEQHPKSVKDFESKVEDIVNKTVNKTLALAETDKVCILVIDEFNRGNVPSLLGELVYALEKDKRGTKVSLPYEMPVNPPPELMAEKIVSPTTESGPEKEKLSKQRVQDLANSFWKIFRDSDDKNAIYVPHNLFIIATMNTSDRSIGTIDAAIRRRFPFVYMPPDIEFLEKEEWLGKENQGITEALKELNKLFKEGEEAKMEKAEIRVGGVGHSYFMGITDKKHRGELGDTGEKQVEKHNVMECQECKKEIANQIRYFVIPLLREYAELGIGGDNVEKIRQIVRDLQKVREFEGTDKNLKTIEAFITAVENATKESSQGGKQQDSASQSSDQESNPIRPEESSLTKATPLPEKKGDKKRPS